MREIYRAQLQRAVEHSSKAEALSYLSSTLRSMLQTMAVSALEAIRFGAPNLEEEVNRLASLVGRFSQPSDGLPIEILDSAIPMIRSYMSRRYILGWFEEVDGKEPLVNALNSWVQFRNKRPGHGVLDAPTTAAWAKNTEELIVRILDLQDVMPVSTDGKLSSRIGDFLVKISTPLLVDNCAIVVTQVAQKKGVWQAKGQLLSWDHAREIMIDLPSPNIFEWNPTIPQAFRGTDVPFEGGATLVFNNVPVRQTTTFVGRKKEKEKLSEWMREVADSRMCLIFGDGGFGKTTLALEYFNSLLEGSNEDKVPLPTLISFYTAKKTKWTEEGLVHFKGISDAMEDSVRELMYCFESVLGKDWFKVNGHTLIDKAKSELVAQGFSRDDVLLIIDNTETLATSALDTEKLGEFISQVSKKLGRVVITSRRRELLAAEPIPVSQLEEGEALVLMKKLAEEHDARAIKQAGDAKLRHACTQLMYKPLLIDTFVRYLSRSDLGIQDGLEHILRKTSDQLLEFLYEDAWARMMPASREVFIVLVSLATPLDGKTIGDVCMEIGIQHAEFQASLAETYFATTVDRGDTYEIEIVDLAKEFFRQKKKKLMPADAQRLENLAFKADKGSMARYEIEKNYRTDRVADAFRSEFAKAAKMATIRRDYESAREAYELALIEEPLNAALRERYASFLLRAISKEQEALPHALEATKLDPDSGDAWLTLGLIKYKIGDLAGGDVAIDKAFEKGKGESICMLRKAIARYHDVRREPYSKRALRSLKEAEALLEHAIRAADPRDLYARKNRDEADKHLFLVRQLAMRINRREASAEKIGSTR